MMQAEVLASMSNGIWKQQTDDGPEVWRRSVYIYRKRGLPLSAARHLRPAESEHFLRRAQRLHRADPGADADERRFRADARRRLFANRLQEAAPGDPSKQVDLAYRLALSRPPDASGAQARARIPGRRTSWSTSRTCMFNLNEFLYVR